MKDVRLPCNSVGEPAPAMKWTKDRHSKPLCLCSEDLAIPVMVDGHRHIQANGTLILRSMKAEDSGYYTCTATNTWGLDTIIGNFLAQDQPCLMASKTLVLSIPLAWIPGNNGGSSIRGFVLRYSVDNREEWKDIFITSSELSFELDSLKCGTWYKVKLVAKNSVGAGHISESIEAKAHSRGHLGLAEPACQLPPEVFLTELREATRYELRMKACDPAGGGNESVPFAMRTMAGEGDGMRKRLNFACPIILATHGVALLFVIRRKRTEKRLKRLRDAKSLAEMLISWGPPHGPRLHIDTPRVQLLVEDKEGIKRIGDDKATIPVTLTEFNQAVNP
ncbi:hypothetical protein lerEdw1_009955 [Lerista edwardsae]|nr:hypothetical protein lerEdw1_009955 [Lerista edwardsae]